MNFKFLSIILVLFGHSAQASESFQAQVTHVTDGDTVWVQPVAGGAHLKLRLEGMDAPEICQAGGDESRLALQRLILHENLVVKIRAQDDYGRALARLTSRGHDIGAEMVMAGQAWSYRWRRSMGPYIHEEQSARRGRRGIFSSDDPQLPREFRKLHGSCFPPQP